MVAMAYKNKVWNPFKKAYWTKDNLIGTDQERQEFKEKWEEATGKKDGSDGKVPIEKKLEKMGCLLTAVITVPLVGFAFFGIVGGIIGIIIAAVVLFARKK